MNSPISIITPSYNQGQFLEQTIDSVLTQGYDNLQFIIIDGGSVDNSVEIIKKNQKHLYFWVSEPDKGQSNAINKGLFYATGSIINWLNSDDYLEPNALKTINENFSDPAVNVVVGRSNIILNAEIIKVTNGTDVYANNLAKTIGMARIDQPETFFRRSIFDKLAPLDEHLHYVMDKEFWMRYLILEGLQGVKKIPNVLTNFRLHETSKTQTQSKKFNAESIGLMYQLAISNNLEIEANKIKNHFSFDNLKFDKKRVGFESEEKLIKDALSYFNLYKADEAYYNHDHKLCRTLLSGMDIENLSSEDKNLFSKLIFRGRFIPVWLKKILR